MKNNKTTKLETRSLWERIVAQSYLWLLLTILYVPILLIIIFSFTQSKVFGNWTGFTFGLYENLFTGYDTVAQVQVDPNLYRAIFFTIVIALCSAIISTMLGTLAAIGIYYMQPRGRKALTFLNSVPMINPDILTGISLFLLFVFLGISRGLGTVIAAHVVFCTPYVVLSVLPRLSKMDPNIYEAALDLGATPFQALRKVMMPELWPGMISGFLLSLTLSIDDFGVTFFTKGSNGLETLSTFIYADARKGGLTPELRPLFSLIFLTILVLLIIMNIRTHKQHNKQPN
jgi:spermidine/putrescine transport system permease protein